MVQEGHSASAVSDAGDAVCVSDTFCLCDTVCAHAKRSANDREHDRPVLQHVGDTEAVSIPWVRMAAVVPDPAGA